MFGYVLPNLESLEEAERSRYRAVYCGVCRSIEERYGQISRLTTSFDLTFMALVLGSLYEVPEDQGSRPCLLHPINPRPYAKSECTDYAADLSVALAYHKLLDDWHDDHTGRSLIAAGTLRRAYGKAKKRLPYQCVVIEQAMQDIRKMEQHALQVMNEGSFVPDEAANRFGILLGDLFAWRDDFWMTDLRRFGARLGKFVYVMDAAMDLEEDLKTGSFNPFKNLEHSSQALRIDLEYLAASMTDAFERLPLERDMHVMRSVLYAGVWQRFEAKEKKDHDG